MIEFLTYCFLAVGIVFNAIAVLGVLRFPDVYTRLHAEAMTTTFGSMFVILAVILHAYQIMKLDLFIIFSIHSLVALAALLIVNPTGAHAIARAAHKSGVKPAGVTDCLETRDEKK